jgi:hypothetical protein
MDDSKRIKSKKHLYVVCTDCTPTDASSVKNAILDLVDLTWAAAAKPLSCRAELADIFEVKIELLTDQRHGESAFAMQRQSFLGILSDAGTPIPVSEILSRLEESSTEVKSTDMALSRADAISNAMCDMHLEAAYAEFLESLPDLSAELQMSFDNFGDLCAGAIDQAAGTFDALASPYEGTYIYSAKRKELLDRVLGQLEPIYRSQLKALDDMAWDRMKQSLSKLRLGDPSLLSDMNASVKEADIFFREKASKMVSAEAPWSSEHERREMCTKMRSFVMERLQAARLQGSYVPGMLRRPVAVSLHYLASNPFQMLDALQDTLSYQEDMNWQPDAPQARSLKDIPKTGRKIAERAEISRSGQGGMNE